MTCQNTQKYTSFATPKIVRMYMNAQLMCKIYLLSGFLLDIFNLSEFPCKKKMDVLMWILAGLGFQRAYRQYIRVNIY